MAASRLFGEVDGQAVHEVTIRSRSGAEANVITWGAVVRDLLVPNGGDPQRVVLGFETLDDYRAHSPYFGAIAGRYANRIDGGRFSLDGESYQLSLNEKGRHSLHGGEQGFPKKPWQLAWHDEASAALVLVSPDGDQGYPGTVTTTCIYRLLDPAVLRVELTATTDAATPINLAHHSYFNLDGSPSILDHELQLDADFYTPTDAALIPTGEIREVAGTPYDFRNRRPVRLPDPATGEPFHYDINFVLRRDHTGQSGVPGLPLARAGTFASPRNGLSMEIWSTEPGLQVYDGFMLDVSAPGLGGARYGANGGVCFEPQHFPDSPNNPHFPDTILRPGEVYRQVTEYRFASS
jgi:aldose 1-epimerase